MKAVELDTIEILRAVGWANSNSEARRMIESGGLRIDGEVHRETEFYLAGSSFIMSFGRRRFIRITIPAMKKFDMLDPPGSEGPGPDTGLGSDDDQGDKT